MRQEKNEKRERGWRRVRGQDGKEGRVEERERVGAKRGQEREMSGGRDEGGSRRVRVKRQEKERGRGRGNKGRREERKYGVK